MPFTTTMYFVSIPVTASYYHLIASRNIIRLSTRHTNKLYLRVTTCNLRCVIKTTLCTPPLCVLRYSRRRPPRWQSMMGRRRSPAQYFVLSRRRHGRRLVDLTATPRSRRLQTAMGLRRSIVRRSHWMTLTSSRGHSRRV